MVVKTRVMSSFKILKTPLPPVFCFSSSSANSRTFHGYRVVMAISAACNKASVMNKNENKEMYEITSSLWCFWIVDDDDDDDDDVVVVVCK